MDAEARIMEIEEWLAKLERIPFKIVIVGGWIFAVLTVITIEIFEYSKLLKYLWLSW